MGLLQREESVTFHLEKEIHHFKSHKSGKEGGDDALHGERKEEDSRPPTSVDVSLSHTATAATAAAWNSSKTRRETTYVGHGGGGWGGEEAVSG